MPDRAASEQMHGPMMQTLLEDRFALKIRRAPKDLPVYFLTVAKRGPKIEPIPDGGRVPRDPDKFAQERRRRMRA